MLFTQFNMDDALAVRYEEGVEDGIERGRAEGLEAGLTKGKAEGRAEDILELLGELGPVPEKMREKICGITDLKVLGNLLKLAARTDSLEEFEKNLCHSNFPDLNS